MKRTILALSALTLSLGLTLPPLSATAAKISSATIAQQMPNLALILEKVMPPVVSINIKDSITINTSRMPHNFQQFFGDDSPFCQGGSPLQSSPFRQGDPSGNGGDQQQKFMALSPGVVIDANKGYVVTNNHVVNNTTVIKVQLSDGRRFDAKMVGEGPRFDIALVQVQNPENLTAIKIADSDALRVGDYTVAIGNSFGLGETVASGIVSVLGHSGLNAEGCENFIQTDIVVNRDNSSGALVNLNGELIGISAVILAPDGGNIGTGFAIPSNMMKNLTSQMVEYDQVKRSELGIMGTELNFDLTEAIKADAQRGAFVSQILPNSSTARAGIKAGGMITSLNDKPISSFAALRAQVGTTSVDSKLTLSLLCDGRQVSVNLELQQSSQNQVDFSTISNGIEGAEISSKGKDQSVVVNNVGTGTPATQIGLRRSDVIIDANQWTVKNIAELRKVLDSKPSVLILSIQYGDSTIHLLM